MRQGRSSPVIINTNFVNSPGRWLALNAAPNYLSLTSIVLTLPYNTFVFVAVFMFLTACGSKRTVTQDSATLLEGITVDRSCGEAESSVMSFQAKWTPVGNLLVLVPDTSAPAFITNKTYNFNRSDTTKKIFQNSTFSNAVIDKEVSEPPLAEKSANWLLFMCCLIVITTVSYYVGRFINKTPSK